MKISVVSPVYNEERFIKIWLTSACKYADQIVLTDTGSTDGTIEIIKKHNYGKVKLDLIEKKEEIIPYKIWNQSSVRNDLIKRSISDVICMFDVDEIINSSMAYMIFSEINKSIMSSYNLMLVSFWNDFNTIRINEKDDNRWNIYIRRIIRKINNIPTYIYNNLEKHCYLIPNQEISNKYFDAYGKLTRYLPEHIKLFHLHYALGFKYNDNRNPDGYEYSKILRSYNVSEDGEKPPEIIERI